MKIRQPWVLTSIALLLGYFASLARAADLARFDFEAPATGNQVTNLGVGPSGILLNGATVSNGVFNVDGLGQGLDIPLGVLNPFAGNVDWRVAFDFLSEDEGGGPLFSSDSSDCDVECNDGEQAGSINIFLTDGGEVIADAWFIGAIGTEPGFNDGQMHSVELNYTAGDSLWELFIDGELADEAEWEYSRDASHDRIRVGDQSNPDFGFEDIDPGMDGIVAIFDNLVIEAPAPPPVLITIDRATGAMSMESIIEDEFSFNSLSITSASSSLDSEKWISITGNYDAVGNGSIDTNNSWTIVSATGEELSENEAGGDGGKLSPRQMVALGEGVWLASPLEDVQVELFDTVAQDTVRGAVAYAGEALLFGDLNLDGDLNGLDWNLFVEGFGQDLEALTGREAYFLGDLDGDGDHNADDFIEFVEAYDAANGAGAFAASVPEPSGLVLLGLGGLGLLARRRRRRVMPPSNDVQKTNRATWLLSLLVAFCVVSAGQTVRADLLAEYLFANDTSDSSGNGRTGILDKGIFGDGDPQVFNGVLDLTGKAGESMIIPLGDANPFDGSRDFTIDLTFTASINDDETGYLLIGSADETEPSAPDNHSMAIFLDGEGSIVYDNFFVGEVRVEEMDYRDDAPHELRIAFTAPGDIGDPNDPVPGNLFIRVDGDWLGSGQIAPNVPNIGNHSVRLGSSLNEDFPFECEEVCAVLELEGAMDNVRIYDESFAPTQLRAEVDRATGAIKLIGGEFVRDIKYYEIHSEAGALNPEGWAENNLDSQNTDALGDATGQSWDTLAGFANRLVEGFLLGSSLFDDSRMVTLGSAYAGGAEDLEIEIVSSDHEIFGIDVTYVGEGNLLDCNGDGVVSEADLLCACAAGIRDGLLAQLNLLEGDLDGNGEVAFADFLVLSANFGGAVESYAMGDIDCNGQVEFADFLVLSANFGQSSSANLAAVPEPAGFPVLVMAILWLPTRLNRRGRR